jgi:hypothetical protein
MLLPSAGALAAPDPDPHTISLDGLSPSGLDPADLLNPGGPPPSTQVLAANLGLQLGDDLDALSPGTDAVQDLNILFFSVDRMSAGVGPNPLQTPLDVFGQAGLNQQAGDIFVTTTQAGVWSVPVGFNGLHINQSSLGELPQIGPLVQNANPANQDRLDAMTFEEFDLVGNDLVQDVPVYFSLDAASPSLVVPVSAADILISPAGGGLFGVFAPAASMGLVAGQDDLDALVLLDLGVVGMLDPGQDLALFSLAPGSVSGGPADIFMTTFGGNSWIQYPAGSLGLLPSDNVDALEVQIPEPGCLMLLLVGAVGCVARRRR